MMKQKKRNSKDPTSLNSGNANLRKQTFLPKSLIAILTVVFIIALVALTIAVIFYPQRFQNEYVRFIILVLLSFIFAFVFYAILPQRAQIKKIPIIKLEVEVVGPASLFIISLLLLANFCPHTTSGRFYILNYQGEKLVLQLETLMIKSTEGKCRFYPANDGQKQRLLEGIYVEFVNGEKECKANIGSSVVTYSVLFDRYASSKIVELRKRKEIYKQ